MNEERQHEGKYPTAKPSHLLVTCLAGVAIASGVVACSANNGIFAESVQPCDKQDATLNQGNNSPIAVATADPRNEDLPVTVDKLRQGIKITEIPGYSEVPQNIDLYPVGTKFTYEVYNCEVGYAPWGKSGPNPPDPNVNPDNPSEVAVVE